MKFEGFSFGKIRINGVTYDSDVVIVGGKIRKRKRKPSKKYRDQFGHTPLSADEDLLWDCRRLIVGSGAYRALPVMEDVKREALRRGVELTILPTAEVIEELLRTTNDTNAILHVTC